MATKVVMEALSPTMEEGRLIKWHKSEGDIVKGGDVIAEIETDKAVMELVARGDGVLRARLLQEGETAPVGQLVAVIASADEDIGALAAQASVAAPASGADPAAPRVAAPSPPSPPSPLPPPSPAEAPTAAAARQPTPGRTAAPRSSPTRTGAVGGPEGPKGAEQTASDVAPANSPVRNGGRIRSSPLARRLASDRGLDVAAISGTGPRGRVVKRDIEATVTAPASPAAAERPRVVPVEGDFHDVPLTQLRKTIARRLAESNGPVPTFYLTAEYDVERLTDMRAAMAAQGEEYRVSVNDILLKAVATALVQHPEVNAHWMGTHIRYFNRVHLGMAVAIEDGLITPVLFDADSKGLRQIAEESRALAARARARKLTPAEYTGSTFSVSNLGMFGIDEFTAIINPPEAGILAVGAVEQRPVAIDGAVGLRRRMRVTMSCDHRVVDGATGARYLQTLRRLVENPLMLVY